MGDMSKFRPCGEKMMRADVPDSESLFCNSTEGHAGPHAHKFPYQPMPNQEMASLTQIKEALRRIEQEQSAVHETIINRHVGSTEQLKRLEAGQMNILAAQDKLWQAQGKLLATIDAARDFLDLEIPRCINTRLDQFHADLSLKLDAGLKGTADGVALAIAELRKDLAIRSASPLGRKARSGTKRKRAARRTRK